MKVSQEQKEETRRRIIQAAVELITEKGIKGTTMRAVAKGAGVGDATIYNYFPTKESIVYGYYMEAIEDTVRELKGIEDFSRYNLREQIQALFESCLEQFLPDREFVSETFPTVFITLSPSRKRIRSIRVRFIEILEDMFQAAVEVEEISEQVFKEMVYQCLWDYFVATVLYWLKDDSDQFTNTTVFIDKSLGLGYAFIQSGMIDKMVDIASYLFRTHILNRVEMVQSRMEVLGRIKREFMPDEK